MSHGNTTKNHGKSRKITGRFCHPNHGNTRNPGGGGCVLCLPLVFSCRCTFCCRRWCGQMCVRRAAGPRAQPLRSAACGPVPAHVLSVLHRLRAVCQSVVGRAWSPGRRLCVSSAVPRVPACAAAGRSALSVDGPRLVSRKRPLMPTPGNGISSTASRALRRSSMVRPESFTLAAGGRHRRTDAVLRGGRKEFYQRFRNLS